MSIKKIYNIVIIKEDANYPKNSIDVISIVAKDKTEFGKLFKKSDESMNKLCVFICNYSIPSSSTVLDSIHHKTSIIESEEDLNDSIKIFKETLNKIKDKDVFDELIKIDKMSYKPWVGIRYSINRFQS